MEIHGTNDPVIAYHNFARAWPHGAVENARYLARDFNCTQSFTTSHTGWNKIHHTQCANGAEVQLMTIPGARHWPYKNMDTPNICTTCSALGFLHRYCRRRAATLLQLRFLCVCVCGGGQHLCSTQRSGALHPRLATAGPLAAHPRPLHVPGSVSNSNALAGN